MWLIQEFVAVWRIVDRAATAAVPGGGYDRDFGGLAAVADGTQLGAPSRRELPAVRVRCQIDRDTQGGRLRDVALTRAGQQDTVALALTLDRQACISVGLCSADGAPLLAPGDRLEAIETTAGAVARAYPVPPGMYVTGVEDGGFGLTWGSPAQINLLLVRCAPAPLGEGPA
jgi:hypothetical protein